MTVDVASGPDGTLRGPVVLLGGTNLISAYLMPRLRAAGYETLVLARRPMEVPEGFRFQRLDFLEDEPWALPAKAVVISVLPLAVLAGALPRLTGARAIIAIGSTSLFSKTASDDENERATARKLERAESMVMRWCAQEGTPATILRPTLVYDGFEDRNIARMIRVVRRCRILPIARPSSGLRQPIHADDIAKAILGAIDNSAAQDRAFNIAGGEVLTYRAMVERVFESQGLQPRLLLLPVPWLRGAFALAARFGLLRETGFGSAVFERMNQDLVFDAAEGLDVLDYRPRRFEPPGVEPKRRRLAS